MYRETVLIFVYGTLRRHECNHDFLKNAELLASQCWTYGKLYDTGEGYPAMVHSLTSRVCGELYRVNRRELKAIDLLEDYHGENGDNLYNRVQQTVYTDQGSVEAFVYVWAKDEEDLKGIIVSGDWKSYGERNGSVSGR